MRLSERMKRLEAGALRGWIDTLSDSQLLDVLAAGEASARSRHLQRAEAMGNNDRNAWIASVMKAAREMGVSIEGCDDGG